MKEDVINRIVRLEKENLITRRIIVNLSLKLIEYAKRNGEEPEKILSPIIGKQLAKDFTE